MKMVIRGIVAKLRGEEGKCKNTGRIVAKLLEEAGSCKNSWDVVCPFIP